jgi:hypothetical protein
MGPPGPFTGFPFYIYITRLASNEIFSPSNKIHREVSWAKDLSAPRTLPVLFSIGLTIILWLTAREMTLKKRKKNVL